MKIEDILREYEKGCSCAEEKPSDCPECFKAAVGAIHSWALRTHGKVMKPKSLEWCGDLAETAFCSYSVAETSNGKWRWSRSHYPYHAESEDEFPDEASAKDAAQNDFNIRILSELQIVE